MSLNPRTKGQEGEREVARMLNDIVAIVREGLKLPTLEKDDYLFQRNQNQSAVGGSDLSNKLHLEIEVKRQEDLAISQWWNQCTKQANRTQGIPILIFRQNRKAWRVMMYSFIPMQPMHVGYRSYHGPIRMEMRIECFKQWFETYYTQWAKMELSPKAPLNRSRDLYGND